VNANGTIIQEKLFTVRYQNAARQLNKTVICVDNALLKIESTGTEISENKTVKQEPFHDNIHLGQQKSVDQRRKPLRKLLKWNGR
jgi:hypothetical protein